MDPKNQLRFLDGVIFAADDSEAVAALKSITAISYGQRLIGRLTMRLRSLLAHVIMKATAMDC